MPGGLFGRQIPKGEIPTRTVGFAACTSRFSRSMNRSTLLRRQSASVAPFP
jgi:hypothetical protein